MEFTNCVVLMTMIIAIAVVSIFAMKYSSK